MTSNYITVNNIKLHYVEEGTGELVILLHGFPEYWYGWRNQIPVFSKNYRVIAPDMRGYNLSDKPQNVSDYKIETLAADIAALIKGLGAEKAIVVGHDWGAAVAWAVASLYPEVVSKLAILNVPHPAEMRKAFLGFNFAQIAKSYYIFLFQIPALPEKLLARDLHGFFAKSFEKFKPSGKPSPITVSVIAIYVESFKQQCALTWSINYYRASLRN
ncbi:MAG: alpha/beta hydrolase, partial [Bacteroidota bacterium]|nr:alpha/beta hydrolase [Bacteroidota bacterium]